MLAASAGISFASSQGAIMKNQDDKQKNGISRRDLFKRAGVIGITAAGSAALLPLVSEAAAPQTQVLHAVETLTAQQFGTLSAITARIFPTDANGPGALEAHAANYIDKALNSHYSYQKDNYTANLAAIDAYSNSSHGGNFAELSPDKQDAVLTAIEAGTVETSAGFVPDAKTFFNLVLEHTQEGMFSDPYYGGNANFIGWDLLDFPGVKLGFTAEEQQLDYPIAKAHRSAYSYTMFKERKQ
jgi:gluconate 2-dehydrogenase gamma chain